MKNSTKVCPKCKNTKLVLLYSQNVKVCPNCNTEIPWDLDPNQKPLLVNTQHSK